jgi:BirA family biotin operon repressor/biotin-[acetyl-CoA-carboxylase] ligase
MDNKSILEILISADGYVSGQSLAERLGVSRQAVWKGIKALKENGYVIQSVTNKGYRLTELPNYLNAPAVKKSLNTQVIGKDLVVLDSVGSTNDYLKQLGNEGAPNGTVVAAREQTKGKGRLGREWKSSRDKNIAFSVLLRPKMTPAEVGEVTPLAGLAMCKALREYAGLDCMIKWPNDIVVGNKKLVGILTEMTAEFDAVEYIVI